MEIDWNADTENIIASAEDYDGNFMALADSTEKGRTMSSSCAPCPVCYGHNLHVAEFYDGDDESSYRMVCDDCGYEDPDSFEEEYVALDHWNRRVVKGYIEGEDPTDTPYDKLEEDDWEPRGKKSDDIGDISWDAPAFRR